eukprot:3708161-Alexandrium_andersonii.AAC.1
MVPPLIAGTAEGMPTEPQREAAGAAPFSRGGNEFPDGPVSPSVAPAMPANANPLAVAGAEGAPLNAM